MTPFGIKIVLRDGTWTHSALDSFWMDTIPYIYNLYGKNEVMSLHTSQVFFVVEENIKYQTLSNFPCPFSSNKRSISVGMLINVMNCL